MVLKSAVHSCRSRRKLGGYSKVYFREGLLIEFRFRSKPLCNKSALGTPLQTTLLSACGNALFTKTEKFRIVHRLAIRVSRHEVVFPSSGWSEV